jgi:hypothetical protein
MINVRFVQICALAAANPYRTTAILAGLDSMGQVWIREFGSTAKWVLTDIPQTPSLSDHA